MVFFVSLLLSVGATPPSTNIRTLQDLGTSAAATDTTVQVFQGTGNILCHGIKGPARQNLPEAMASRAPIIESGVKRQASLITQAAHGLATSAQNNVETAQAAVNSIQTICMRSGRGCAGSVEAIAHKAASTTLESAKQTSQMADTVVSGTEALDSVPLVSLAIGAYSTISAGKQEADDICPDDGLTSYAPVVTRMGGTALGHVAAGSAFAKCAAPASIASTPAGGFIAGIICATAANYIGDQITTVATDTVRQRQRWINHQTQIRSHFETLMAFGKIDGELLQWQNDAIRAQQTYNEFTLELRGGRPGQLKYPFWIQASEKAPSFVTNWLDRARARGIHAEASALIDGILSDDHDGNSFKPSSPQVAYFLKEITAKWCLPADWKEWVELWDHNDILYTGFKPAVITDQKKRAKTMVDIADSQKLKGSGKFTVTMMDGHGRQWLAALKEFRARGYDINNIILRIVDIDPSVNAWHTAFFPSSGTEVVDQSIYLENVPGRGMLYLNFCGLCGSNDELTNRLANFELRGELSKVMVSMSSRAGKNPDTYYHLKGMAGVKEVCKRGKVGLGFHTFAWTE